MTSKILIYHHHHPFTWWTTGVQFPAGAGIFSLRHRVHICFGSHPAAYPMGTASSYSDGKAAGAWSWPLTCI